jgi:ornithine cyclodeaminase
MIALGTEDILRLMSPIEAIAAVEAALRANDQGQCTVPERHRVERAGSAFLFMPAVGREMAGMKLVSVVPGNVKRNLPVTIGLMVLISAQSGEPLAVLNAGTLTALRTGAVGALGVKYMTPPDSSSLGIVGCGVQGTWQAIAACAVRSIKQVFAVKRSAASFDVFAATVRRHAPGVTIVPCADARELLSRTRIVITATTSPEPVVPDELALLEGRHFISVGSYRQSMQELPDSVYRLAGELAIDSEAARFEVGDSVNPVAKGILRDADIYPVAELVLGRRTVDPSRTSVYKTAGNAMFDLYVAEALFRAAQRRGAGTEFTL